MIKDVDKVRMVVMGTGDVFLGAGIASENKNVGTVSIANKEPGPIGVLETFDKIRLEDIDERVRLIFTETASIDIFIETLLQAREFMIKGEVK